MRTETNYRLAQLSKQNERAKRKIEWKTGDSGHQRLIEIKWKHNQYEMRAQNRWTKRKSTKKREREKWRTNKKSPDTGLLSPNMYAYVCDISLKKDTKKNFTW